MTPDFNVADASTWPAILNAEELAQILRRKVGGLKKSVRSNRAFVPAPFQRRPYRWRRSDVERFVESGRGGSLRRVG
jgi:hypothetical protein